MTRKVKSVSFNLNDPFEIELYEHTMKYPNFSSFVKRLIQSSLNGKTELKQVQKAEIAPIEQVSIQRDLLQQLI
jgi:hypothetical protein